MPHTHREAAAFISRLNDMVTTEEASHGPGTGERVEAESEKDKALPTGQSLIAATTNSDKNSLTNGIDAKKAATESSFSSPVPTRLDGLVKVNAIDGSGSVSFRSKIQILLIYFLFNLGLTLYNKAVMIMFPFPFLVTALHAASGIVGTQLLLARGSFTLKNLSRRDNAVLSAFSILYTANIAVSNVSLAMVTIPFHQTVRALTPVFTVAIYRVVFSSIYSTATYISLIPVILGVGLASYGDLNATILGFFMTLFGTLLAAIKTVTTNRLQTAGLHLSALELLHRMSPIACVQSLVVAYITGEFDHFEPQLLGSKGLLILLVNGIIAFGLNVASFEANKRSGALTMTIAANVKQVLTVVLSVIIWRVPVGALNAFGIVLTLTGGAWYGRVEFMGKAAESTESRMEQGATSKA
ncbi:MAG: hypothetical protein LQ338_002535 [Usnochroma carphineum]|nr:MAG: hypothetical protein LQ338_002535 [Usnochroma carphineum]